MKHRIAIAGATGYTGSELVRLLLNHPEVELAGVTSERYAGAPFSKVHPQFAALYDQELVALDDLESLEPELVFLALPHGVSMETVARYSEANFRIIDLSGDFRLSSAAMYAQWYGTPHVFPKGLEKAVFGLPELFRPEIAQARLVANPGCFPTASILALAPLLTEGWVSGEVIVDAKTGVTGAGVKASDRTHFPSVHDNFSPYGVKNHRHTIEIEETLSRYAKTPARVQFTPHLLPVDRGILATCYAQPTREMTDATLRELYREYYGNEPFVRWREEWPSLKPVRGTNMVDIHATYDPRTGRVLVVSAIDNLVKGAAGQAVQNMNLMLGLKETAGLHLIPFQP